MASLDASTTFIAEPVDLMNVQKPAGRAAPRLRFGGIERLARLLRPAIFSSTRPKFELSRADYITT